MFATLYKPLSESESTWSEAKITDIFKIISYNYRSEEHTSELQSH